MKQSIFSMNKLYRFILSLFSKNKQEQKGNYLPVADYTAQKTLKQEADLTALVEEFLNSQYAFRFNEITGLTEYRQLKENNASYLPVQQRELNSFCMEARQCGVSCWDRDISRFIYSKRIPTYHPFLYYMDHLPVWDGKDRVEQLARRVSTENEWVSGFHTWMLGLASQWMQLPSLHGNSIAPVLVSRRQGMNKSTFCRMLVPDPLQPYYTDSFDMGATAGAEQKLTAFGLINLDELDKYSERKMACLKNLMQMTNLTIRKAHQKSYTTLPRIASFIATSNRKDLLTDPTGSRRFLCTEIEKKIDCSPIGHKQLYAQLKAELGAGKRCWFTGAEENVLMEHNEAFRKRNMTEDLFYSCFRLPQNDEKGRYLSAVQIYNELKRYTPSSARMLSPANFGKTLVALGVERKHTKHGNFYHVISNI